MPPPSPPSRRIRAVFSDLDGTIVHFPAWFEQHGTQIASCEKKEKRGSVRSPSGEVRECRLLPSSTMGDGFVSERTISLVQELRSEGVLFVIVTAARKSTLIERLPLLPICDAAVCETGSRIYLQAEGGELPGGLSSTPDPDFCRRIEHVCGPLEREVEVEERPEPLWQFFRKLRAEVAGLKCDSRSYYGCFRVDTMGEDTVDAALRQCIRENLPSEVDWAMNLGKYDFFPSASGKGNVVSYLQEKFGVKPEESACLFDDDNDLPMAQRCGLQFLPGLTSDSVRRAAMEHPDWVVASNEGQGVFAIEECLERLLALVREESTSKQAVPA